ncbi:DUF2381 family protein [Archangium sp.]|uniref:DUF2381 family protein n=1 Tax=Archangium sp. TaxID=1872627 RepID=UPI00286B94B2|nr:DUF2381 family protein [Archangium sp.]
MECARVQRVELGAGPASRPPEVCVSPGKPTHFLFDTPLREAGVRLEERERFIDMAVGGQSVTVYPSKRVVAGKPYTLTACFADGAPPACSTFLLVPHPTQATSEVTVVRPPPPEVDLQRELARQRALVEQLQAQLARTQAECQGPTGLTGLLAPGFLRDGESLKGADISTEITYKQKTGDLRPDNVASYRAGSRIAFAMSLRNKSPLAWDPREVTLRAPTGAPLQVLSVWPRQPLLPGESARVVVEAATPEEGPPPGPYILTFGPEDEPSLVLEQVRFP